MYRQLDATLQKIAENELNEKTNQIQEDLEHIRQWIRKEPHLNFEIEDQLLVSFLRCSKFSLERTKERIDHYYTIRTLSPEIFTNRDPFLPEIQAILNAGYALVSFPSCNFLRFSAVLPLPKPHYNGNRILLFTYENNLNPNTMTYSNVIKTIYMVLDIIVKEDDHCVVSGIKSWSLCRNLSSKYVTQVTPVLISKYMSIAQNGTPIRIKEMLVTECPSFFQYVYNFLKLFCSKKLSERLFIFAQFDSKEFQQKIPLELFPEELGGSNGSVEKLTAEWKAKVESYRDWFISDEKLKSNENLRKGAPRTGSELFGTEGSFRKLNID